MEPIRDEGKASGPRPGASLACEAALRVIEEVLAEKTAEMTVGLKAALAHRIGEMLRHERRVGEMAGLSKGASVVPGGHWPTFAEAERVTIMRVRDLVRAQAEPFRPARTEFAGAVVLCCDGLIEQLRNMEAGGGIASGGMTPMEGLKLKLYPAVGATETAAVVGERLTRDPTGRPV